MIKRLLIANRGEIAVRIIRTCREMDIETVVVYSEADKDSLPVKMADQAVCIGPAPSGESYLKKESLISAALGSRCEAVHPGVGFLSENADFAELAQEAGLIFIGPDPHVTRMLGDKVQAKRTADEAGLPLIPGSDGAVESVEKAVELAKTMGFPLIVKAASGGGGKGMRIVNTIDELKSAFPIASREALNNFGDPTLYMEKYMTRPRHVEVQLLADGKDNVIYLGERDCSVQKNHQKLLEESPSGILTDEMRAQMEKASVTLFRNIGYAGAGTIEFLVEGGEFYFMEVNARVQVEHTVTELMTGVDIIRQQILACTTGKMEITQKDVRIQGYALEARINARGAGRISQFIPPMGPSVRVDTHIFSGYMVPPYYDSMIAKVLIQAPNRNQGIKRMIRVLKEMELEGVDTNSEEQITLLSCRPFRSGKFDTALYGQIIKD
ncbi:MAG: acetyl-CoA carboxylase biotin carboxylase subunit [Spirochaetales bacterium]|nr:acetyl-CoA carboxylase biotin carboxylase subunit [Spirochaetales bacterium]